MPSTTLGTVRRAPPPSSLSTSLGQMLIRPVPAGTTDYDYMAEIDLTYPLQRIPELDERNERHVKESWAANPIEIKDPNA
jgi:hypothetical protein